MTGTESRSLTLGTRVCWDKNKTDQGTVTARDWGGVNIDWDNAHTTYFHHNNMKEISVVPKG
jgi:hypothetical protein